MEKGWTLIMTKLSTRVYKKLISLYKLDIFLIWILGIQIKLKLI